jgi:hypothetical protein
VIGVRRARGAAACGQLLGRLVAVTEWPGAGQLGMRVTRGDGGEPMSRRHRGVMSEAKAAELGAPFTDKAAAELRELAARIQQPDEGLWGPW